MANVDELNAKLLDLKVKMRASHYDMETCYQALCSHLMAVFEKNLDISTVKVACSDTGAIVQVANHTIDLYFETLWREEDGKYMKLKMNFGCFGSFSDDDKDEVKYCEVIGHIAGIMSVLEHQLFKTEIAIKLWNDYHAARREFCSTAYEIRSIENEIKSIEHGMKRNEILSKIAVGRKIMVARATCYHSPIIKTIEHITSKNIIFEEDYGSRTKKDDLISNILAGKWSLV